MGREIKQSFKSIEISEEYKNTMKSLAKDLCDRSNKLKAEAKDLKYSLNVSVLKENAQNLTIKGKDAFEKQTFYSSASYCFGANVEYSTLLLLSRNLSKGDSINEVENIKREIINFTDKLENTERKTITDLEAYIVVKERLRDAEDSADQALEILNQANKTERAVRSIAYASERINSAYSWATFLGKSGKAFNLNKDVLKKSCQNKISEADEREQYVELYFPNTLDKVKDDISKANEELEKGNYELCLSQASKAKAEVDTVLSVFGVDSEQYWSIADRKLDIVRDSIAKQSAKGIFPILGYSYYEYANSLKENDVYSALLYSEYALELGNLDIYFKESNGGRKSLNADAGTLGIFLAGILVGLLAASLIKRKSTEIKNEHKPKQNKNYFALPGKKR